MLLDLRYCSNLCLWHIRFWSLPKKSDTRAMVTSLLDTHDYVWQEFHLSPLQFGIPNQRMRYYLLVCASFCFPVSSLLSRSCDNTITKCKQAKKKPNSFAYQVSPSGILQWVPTSSFFTPMATPTNPVPTPLAQYLGVDTEAGYMVPEKVLLSSGILFGIQLKALCSLLYLYFILLHDINLFVCCLL